MTHAKDEAPICHFTPMEFHSGEYGESWGECSHCGHTKEITPIEVGEH